MEFKKVAVMLITKDAMPVVKKTVDSMYAKASYPFDLFVLDNGSKDGTREYLDGFNDRATLIYQEDNKGLPKSYNILLDVITKKDKYDFLVFVEDDCYFETGDWLQNLLTAHHKVVSVNKDRKILLSPYRIGHVVPGNIFAFEHIDDFGYALTHDSLPTTCMLAHMDFFDDFRFDERKPMHWGDRDIGEQARKTKTAMAYVLGIVVKHIDMERPKKERERFDRFINAHIPYGI